MFLVALIMNVLNVMLPSKVCVHPYQWFSCGVQLVFGPSEQKTPCQEVESLSASLRAVVHLSFPQFVLIERRTTQKPERQMERDSEETQSHFINESCGLKLKRSANLKKHSGSETCSVHNHEKSTIPLNNISSCNGTRSTPNSLQGLHSAK